MFQIEKGTIRNNKLLDLQNFILIGLLIVRTR